MQYQSSAAEQFAGDSDQTGSSWRLFSFLLVIFSVMLSSYVGLNVGYRAYLTSSIADYDEKISASGAKLEIKERKDLVAFYSQMINLRDILKSHIFASKIFPFLESSTNLKVAYTTVGLSVPDRTMTIDGLAGSFDALVQQLAFWQQSGEVEKIILEDNSTVNDTVRFRADITFKNDFFFYSDLSASQTEPAQ